ncbi:putative heavy metal-associated domain, HMA, heavy metal-associated domain superfamily [Dioscorea sansibarensis]
MGGTLDYFSSMFGSGHKTKRRKHLNTVELKVRMDCDGCELKIKKVLSSMKGVESVEIDRKQQKVTVIGFVEPNMVLKKVVSIGKQAEIWPYVPYNLVAHPYTVQSYDKKAPPGFVRNVDVANASFQVTKQEDQLTNLFSDDNPNACSVM